LLNDQCLVDGDLFTTECVDPRWTPRCVGSLSIGLAVELCSEHQTSHPN
jgi:hypothetical protein